ncbi:MAG: hypothetical protein LBG21_02605 [Campylobacteraceae bacterium]|jgi:uncharacterized membrane protein YebE (DUF533 family)|nr:hypothetical protein [Campylobacteraceae bacterium]
MAKVQSNNNLKTKREIAKIGMTASLGILTLSAFMLKNKSAKKLHTAAGIALIGFSFWHHKLYQPKQQQDDETKPAITN